mgnify:FL=1|jgi:hypothetical protein
MILLIMFIVLVIANMVFPRNKLLTGISFIYMWVLMGWSYGNADYEFYVLRYKSTATYYTLEPLYVILQNIAKSFEFQYSTFLILMSFIFLLIRFFVILKFTDKPNYVISLWMLYPFIMDIVQIRQFYATTIVMLGIYFLFASKKLGSVKFVICVMLATLIHSSNLVYMLLLVPYLWDFSIKKFKRVIFLMVIVSITMLRTGLLKILGQNVATMLGFGVKFRETFIAANRQYSLNNLYYYVFQIVVLFILCEFVFRKIDCIKSDIVINNGINSMKFIEWAEKSNWILLLVIPLVWFSGDIYRIQHGFLTIVYIVASLMTRNKGLVIKKSYLLGKIAMCLTALLFFYWVLLYVPSLRETTFIPAFYNNRLFMN